MSETNIQNEIRIALGTIKGLRLFRNNTGMGWAGKLFKRDGNLVVLTDARPLHAVLIEGSSDLIGWKTITITPEMVGSKLAIFTAVEVKSAKGIIRDKQTVFLKNVQAAGGIAIIARTPNEAQELLK